MNTLTGSKGGLVTKFQTSKTDCRWNEKHPFVQENGFVYLTCILYLHDLFRNRWFGSLRLNVIQINILKSTFTKLLLFVSFPFWPLVMFIHTQRHIYRELPLSSFSFSPIYNINFGTNKLIDYTHAYVIISPIILRRTLLLPKGAHQLNQYKATTLNCWFWQRFLPNLFNSLTFFWESHFYPQLDT